MQVATTGPDPQHDSNLAAEGYLRLRSRPTTNFVGDLMAEGAVDLVMAELDGSWAEHVVDGCRAEPLLASTGSMVRDAGDNSGPQQQCNSAIAQLCFQRAQKQLLKQRKGAPLCIEATQVAAQE